MGQNLICQVNGLTLVQYGVKKDGNDKDLIDYDEVEALAIQHKPKLIIAGASAYPKLLIGKNLEILLIWLGHIF